MSDAGTLRRPPLQRSAQPVYDADALKAPRSAYAFAASKNNVEEYLRQRKLIRVPSGKRGPPRKSTDMPSYPGTVEPYFKDKGSHPPPCA